MARYSRWLIFAPVAILALFAPSANAEPVAGLNAVGYNFYGLTNGGYPTPSATLYPTCHTEIENNINRNFNGEPFGPCPYDYFMVHYSGFITIPANNTIQFMIAADDGGTIQIGNTQFGTWGVKVCQWSAVTTASFPAGSYALDGWFFEWWGDTCFMLAWNINNTGWVIVPDSAFTTTNPATTTTTTALTTTTTVEPTTTTIQETTTTWASTTTSTNTTTSTTTTSTIAPYETVTVTNPPTITTPQTIYIPQPEPTMPVPPATVPLPQIVEPDPLETLLPAPEIETYPPETLEPPPETYATIEPPQTLPFVGLLPEPPDTIVLPPEIMFEPPDTIFEPPATLPIELILELSPELVQALEDASEDVSLTDEQFDMVVESIADLEPAEAVALIEQILNTSITVEQATELASNPDVLDVITESQAEEIFETLDVTELDNTQIDVLVEAVQSAPTRVRKAFEKSINIFDDGLGDYVPIGSNVPVDSRRTLIAVAAGAITVAAGQRRNK